MSRALVRRYHFGYDDLAHASLLESVALEGRCAQTVSEDLDQALPLTSCPRLPPLAQPPYI